MFFLCIGGVEPPKNKGWKKFPGNLLLVQVVMIQVMVMMVMMPRCQNTSYFRIIKEYVLYIYVYTYIYTYK